MAKCLFAKYLIENYSYGYHIGSLKIGYKNNNSAMSLLFGNSLMVLTKF